MAAAPWRLRPACSGTPPGLRARILVFIAANLCERCVMTLAEARSRHAELVQEIRKHDRAYYVEANPIISDFDYDKLFRELQDLEKEHPQLATPESPTMRVGGAPTQGFQRVE